MSRLDPVPAEDIAQYLALDDEQLVQAWYAARVRHGKLRLQRDQMRVYAEQQAALIYLDTAGAIGDRKAAVDSNSSLVTLRLDLADIEHQTGAQWAVCDALKSLYFLRTRGQAFPAPTAGEEE